MVVIIKLNKDTEAPGDKNREANLLLNIYLARAVHEYYAVHNKFPESQELFMAEFNKLRAENGHEPLSGIPDPWGNPVMYIIPGKVNVNAYDLLSYGADGKASDDDIVNHFVANVWPPLPLKQ